MWRLCFCYIDEMSFGIFPNHIGQTVFPRSLDPENAFTGK